MHRCEMMLTSIVSLHYHVVHERPLKDHSMRYNSPFSARKARKIFISSLLSLNSPMTLVCGPSMNILLKSGDSSLGKTRVFDRLTAAFVSSAHCSRKISCIQDDNFHYGPKVASSKLPMLLTDCCLSILQSKNMASNDYQQ